jgi:hypothetical protein
LLRENTTTVIDQQPSAVPGRLAVRIDLAGVVLALAPRVDDGDTKRFEVTPVSGSEGGAARKGDSCDLAVADLRRLTAALSCCDGDAGCVRGRGVEGEDSAVEVVSEKPVEGAL